MGKIIDEIKSYIPQYLGTQNNYGSAAASAASALKDKASSVIKGYTNQNPNTGYAATTPAATPAATNTPSAVGNTEKPVYAGTYDQQLNDLYSKISNREKFSYDINQDALYQQYAQQYINKGRLAMKDTMGQAAALTGGYGSSYGAQVGQQSYDAYLQQLNDVIPDLYAQAYEQYKDEGDNMMRQYGMLGDLKADEYNKYRDALGDYNYEQETSYNRQQDAYNKLYAVIASSGYTPTDEELLAAGMTRESANNIAAEYQRGIADADWQKNFQKEQFAWQQQNAAEQMAANRQQFADEMAYKYAALEANANQYASDLAYRYAALQASQNASSGSPYSTNNNKTYGYMASAIDLARGSGASINEMYSAVDSAYKAGKITKSEASSLKLAAADDRLRRPR